MVYPDIRAGAPITAELLRGMVEDIVAKPAMESRANNTMVSDADLQYQLEAGATYDVRFELRLGGGTTGKIRTLWVVPTGAGGLKDVIGPGSSATDNDADNINMRSGVHGFGTIIAYGIRSGANTNYVRVWESGRVTTTDAGLLALSWAQVTTDATAAVVGGGSLLRIRRIG